MCRQLLAVALGVTSAISLSQSSTEQASEILSYARQRLTRQNDAWYLDGYFLPVVQSQRLLAELNPHDEETWSNLEWMLQNVEQYDDQWAVTRRFKLENLTYADGAYYEAKLFYFKKAYAKIPALLEPSLKLTPSPDPNVYRILAHSYNKMGYFQDSIRIWDALIKKSPNDLQAKSNRNQVAKKIKA